MTWPQPPTQTPASAAPAPACLFCGNAVPVGCGLCPHCGSSLGSVAATWTLQDPHHDQYAPPPAPAPSVPPWAATPFGPPANPTAPADPTDALYQDYVSAYSANRPNRRLRILIGIAAAVGAVAVIAAVAGSNTGASSSDGPNGVFHSGPAHFSAQFPDVPSTHALTETIDGTHFTENIVVDSPSFTEVLEIASPAGLFGPEASTILSVESREIATSTGWTLGDSESTTFEGSPAQQTDYTASDGSPFTSIMFVYQGSRVYMLVAPAGDPFNALSSSFTITG